MIKSTISYLTCSAKHKISGFLSPVFDVSLISFLKWSYLFDDKNQLFTISHNHVNIQLYLGKLPVSHETSFTGQNSRFVLLKK